MRRNNSLRAFLLSLAFVLGLCVPTRAWAYERASLEVDIGLFYKDLAPYGRWVETREHGWGWEPRVHSDWRPYAFGHWVWTDDYGWLWVSDEDFGWAVYHYGRWYRDPDHEWGLGARLRMGTRMGLVAVRRRLRRLGPSSAPGRLEHSGWIPHGRDGDRRPDRAARVHLL